MEGNIPKVCSSYMRLGEEFFSTFEAERGKNIGGVRKKLEVRKRKKVCAS